MTERNLHDQTAVLIANLRAAGEHSRADAVETAAAYLAEVIDTPSSDLYSNLEILRDNANAIMDVIQEAVPWRTAGTIV